VGTKIPRASEVNTKSHTDKKQRKKDSCRVGAGDNGSGEKQGLIGWAPIRGGIRSGKSPSLGVSIGGNGQRCGNVESGAGPPMRNKGPFFWKGGPWAQGGQSKGADQTYDRRQEGSKRQYLKRKSKGPKGVGTKPIVGGFGEEKRKGRGTSTKKSW